MKRIMFSTDNRLANLVALVQEHLGAASQPFAVTIESAKAQVADANLKFIQADDAYHAAQLQLKQVKATQSNVDIDMTETVTKAEAALSRAVEELDRISRIQMHAIEAYKATCAPVQNWMDVLELVQVVQRTCSEEEQIASRRLDEFEKSALRREEAAKREQYTCQTCRGQGGYCRDCDPAR